MTTLYGIANCDTIKKTRDWLDSHGVEYVFYDYKSTGLDEETLRAWVSELGWEALLNRRGLMWRKLPKETRADIDEESAILLMLETPSIIRRPLLDTGTIRLVGFSESRFQEIFR